MGGLQKGVVKEEREKKAKAKEEEEARKKRKWLNKVARRGREAATSAEKEELLNKIERLEAKLSKKEAEAENWREAWREERDLNVALHTQCVQFHDELVRLRAERESDEGGYDTSMSD